MGERMGKDIKLPWKLPKTFTKDNQIYEFRYSKIEPALPMTYPKKEYIEIKYTNKQWKWSMYFSRWTGPSYWEKLLGIKYEDFIEYENSIIPDHPAYH